MYISVADAIKLPVFKNCQILAGIGGLDRKIYRVSVAECPEFPIDISVVGKHNQLYKDGDFFISSLYALKDTAQYLLDTIKIYNQFNSSGIVITDKYFAQIPDEVIEYANKENYPIITIDMKIPYSEIIMSITKAIFAQESNSRSVAFIDNIINGNYNEEKQRTLVYSLNSDFKKHFMVISVSIEALDNERTYQFIRNINVMNYFFAVNYYEQILIFYNSDIKLKDTTIDFIINTLDIAILKFTHSYKLGISNVYDEIKNFKTAIEESMLANKIAHIEAQKVQFYKNAGLYKLLLQIDSMTTLQKIYDELVSPIVKYDKENKGNLFKTLIAFVENEGNMNKTSKILFQHENTIRYRLKKIKEMMGIENNNIKFYESINIACKLYKILKNCK